MVGAAPTSGRRGSPKPQFAIEELDPLSLKADIEVRYGFGDIHRLYAPTPTRCPGPRRGKRLHSPHLPWPLGSECE